MHERIDTPSNTERTRGTPVTSLEEIDAIQAEELQMATKQIEEIKESLKDLAHRIEVEEPQLLIFLDVSARVLGTPFLKYLSEIMGPETPLVRFYNDHDLKGRYLRDEMNDDLVENDFETLRGKKIFFIDETYSTGKGAIALHEAAMAVGADAYYFALSKDPHVQDGLGDWREHYDISEETHFDKVKALTNEGRIVTYQNPIKNLFARFASRLYVHDSHGETSPISMKSEGQKKSTGIPNANSYLVPPTGMTMEEYVATIAQKSDTFVRAIKDKVYRALKD